MRVTLETIKYTHLLTVFAKYPLWPRFQIADQQLIEATAHAVRMMEIISSNNADGQQVVARAGGIRHLVNLLQLDELSLPVECLEDVSSEDISQICAWCRSSAAAVLANLALNTAPAIGDGSLGNPL